jgi:protein gp37
MADHSAIEWCDSSWNPTVGCSIVSPGCTNCYAMKVAHSLERRFGSKKYGGLTKVVNGNAVWTGEVRLDEDALLQPLKWKRGRRIFVNSMSDVFHESLPDDAIDKIFAVMALCPQHKFQVLTKRAERMRAYCSTLGRHHEVDRVSLAMKQLHAETGFGARGAMYTLDQGGWHFPNIWLGVSCERQQEADERIPLLLQTPAAVRFVSCEPLLGPLDLYHGDPDPRLGGHYATATYIGDWWPAGAPPGVPSTHGLDWVIAGGESGRNARPAHPDWFRSLRDQCDAADVPFFFKQFGEFCPAPPLEPASHAIFPDGSAFRAGAVMGATDIDPATARAVAKLVNSGSQYARITRVGKKAAGRLLDGREHNDMPGRAG